MDEFDPEVAARVKIFPPEAIQVGHASVNAPPRETAPPPFNGPIVLIVTAEFAKFAFVIPADPERFVLVNPEIVFDAAAIVLLVSASIELAVIYPELFVHWEIFGEAKLDTASPEIPVFVTADIRP